MRTGAEPNISPPPHVLLSGPFRSLLIDDSGAATLFLVAGALLGVSAFLLATPDRLLFRLLPDDLLMNVIGAWHLYNGHVIHVDFHTPIGRLDFMLTEAGFWLVGPKVSAHIAGRLLMATGIYLAATTVSVRRLPLLPALVFVLLTCELALLPVNVGDMVTYFAFTMTYNLYGWAMLSILALLLFVPPCTSAANSSWLDLIVGGTLILALYYLKMSYFAAAVVEVPVAFAVSSHIRKHKAGWACVAVLAILNAVAPFNWAYLQDIAAAVDTGGVATYYGWGKLAANVFANLPELSLYVIALMIAAALWHSGQAPLRLPVAAGLLIAVGLGVLLTNTQERAIPLCLVIAFLLYNHFLANMTIVPLLFLPWLLLALLVAPVAALVTIGSSVALYHLEASQGVYYRVRGGDPVFTVAGTNLRGLAVPAEPDGLLDAFNTRSGDASLLNRARAIHTADEVSPFEYVQTLLEAAALLEGASEKGSTVLLGEINPLPFMLGRVPPSGGNLVLARSYPWPPPERMFAATSEVLIPKFPVLAELTREALVHYGPYLAQHFPVRRETRSWIVLTRPASGS